MAERGTEDLGLTLIKVRPGDDVVVYIVFILSRDLLLAANQGFSGRLQLAHGKVGAHDGDAKFRLGGKFLVGLGDKLSDLEGEFGIPRMGLERSAKSQKE